MNSDDEGPRSGGGGDDEVALPKSTINKLIAESLPAGFSAAKEVKDLMAECCKEFLLAVSSEANEICEKDSKKTMLPDHILSALKALGFEEFVSGVEDVLADHKEVKKGEKAKKAKKAAGNGMTEEEMLKIQEELFAKSRARMDAGEGAAPAALGEGEGEAKEEKQEE
ncbi:Histone-fold-containing protein [Rhodotorula toruloides]|uniref:Histone-fold-containing protein n=1 Tax=Rhodotorula toruloides TaxID=5286 RepID=A0A2T0A9A7_RHOTO|nr:Histone-fold-containing protein [Rhodotorula toruloides]